MNEGTLRPGLLALALMLSACGGDDGTATEPVAIDPAQLCVASACGSKTRLLDIPGAENILFTPDGRLFVSGGSNVFEITRAGDAYAARPLLAGSCNFTGLAQRGDVLYAACFDHQLYAAKLTAAPELQAIHALSGMSAPNGMATGPDGELYINDGPISTSGLPTPQVVRLKFDPADPLHVTEQVQWLGGDRVSFPNGIARSGRTLFITDSSLLPLALGVIKRIDIQDDGSAGPTTVIANFLSLPDDLSVVGDSLLVALYTNGYIALVKQDGSGVTAQTDLLSFDSPSQVNSGQPPLFDPLDILVTEKGLLIPNELPFGNALSVYRRNGGRD